MLGRVQEDLQQVLNSSSEGSEDQEDPEHEQFEKAQNHVMQPFAGNFDDSKLDGMTFSGIQFRGLFTLRRMRVVAFLNVAGT